MKLLAETIRAEGGGLPWDAPFAWDAPRSAAAVTAFTPRAAPATCSEKETDDVRHAALAA